MSNLNKKDKFNIAIIIIAFLIFTIIITRFTNYYGSLLDWEAQHIAIPNTLRTLFYQNWNINTNNFKYIIIYLVKKKI